MCAIHEENRVSPIYIFAGQRDKAQNRAKLHNVNGFACPVGCPVLSRAGQNRPFWGLNPFINAVLCRNETAGKRFFMKLSVFFTFVISLLISSSSIPAQPKK